jgi:uncharacterized protein YbaR (Trm112 family)
MQTCPFCNQPLTNQHRLNIEKPKAKHIKYYVNGVERTNLATPYNDAFYEIMDGKWKGNLVHRFDITNL